MVRQPLTDLGGFIREQRERSAMSLRKLAETAGISNPYLSQIERGLRKPSAEILMSIARGLSIRAESLYEKAGLLEAAELSIGVVEAIEGDPLLTKTQKHALAEVYESFVAGAKEEQN
ncbi:MAG: helix-turn-helix transcriptional regulator [Acidimicrobiia bacterium]|nr:helix-turn-helix transcriptional regulator [Acidimicrobiia bacterium]